MAEDLLDDWNVVDQGDQAEASPTPRTRQDITSERPAHQIRPESAACTPPIRIRRVRVYLPVTTQTGGVISSALALPRRRRLTRYDVRPPRRPGPALVALSRSRATGGRSAYRHTHALSGRYDETGMQVTAVRPRVTAAERARRHLVGRHTQTTKTGAPLAPQPLAATSSNCARRRSQPSTARM